MQSNFTLEKTVGGRWRMMSDDFGVYVVADSPDEAVAAAQRQANDLYAVPKQESPMSDFQACEAREDDQGRWCVSSPYWSIPVQDQRTAERLCEIIQGAYRAGAKSPRHF